MSVTESIFIVFLGSPRPPRAPVPRPDRLGFCSPCPACASAPARAPAPACRAPAGTRSSEPVAPPQSSMSLPALDSPLVPAPDAPFPGDATQSQHSSR
ncbi:hypothetical protein PR202_gb19749 [Eleusine coracana subsp. coracana]|uniref:Uncharacterized protein n=1 Tax=Eleusine coracana subsp. coracana TaxID=191504 RepID=A0AAV5FAH6_ELECO|nr:hypothetical protein PR202_gb19749 [Eleusine coracana subsp. coracana]